jgi:hypothetical protein
MKHKNLWQRVGLVVALCACWQAQGETTPSPYPKMAPLEQYLMPRDAEIALARSAAPDSISRDAEVLVLGSHGYDSAVKGKNGFVCVVERSWTAPAGDPNFWNPKLRGPACFNAAGARSYLPLVFKKTGWVLAGQSQEQMWASVKSGFARQELPTMEAGSMCYMMSPTQYLGDADKHWHPHLMFFLPQTSAMAWGAGLPGSPVIEGQDPEDHLTVFLIPVGKWSDGTAEHPADHPGTH